MFLYNLLKPVREDGLLAFLGRQGVMSSSQGHNNIAYARKILYPCEENINGR